MYFDDVGVEAALRGIEARVEYFGERCEGTYALAPELRDEEDESARESESGTDGTE